MRTLFIFFVITASLTLNAQTNTGLSHDVKKDTAGETINIASYTYTTIPAQNKTWGYNIFMGKRLLIHPQSNID
jgi:hypothetical protein